MCVAVPPDTDDTSRRPVLDLKRAGGRVLLIHDALTRDAALSACTRALKQVGARHVDMRVLARVVRETDVTI